MRNYSNEKHSGNRGIFAGGNSGSTYYNNIEYINITIIGNAYDFGDLSYKVSAASAGSNGFTAIICSGMYNSSIFNNIDKIIISLLSNSVRIGDLPVALQYIASGSDGNIMINSGGFPYTISSITYGIFTTNINFVAFGNLIINRYMHGGCSSNYSVFFCNGYANDSTLLVNVIDYVITSILSNATDFGDSIIASRYVCGCSNNIRGIFHLSFGAGVNQSQLEYITMSSKTNASSFGFLSESRYALGSTSNDTRGIFAGYSNTIDYVSINTLGNAVNFGDLLMALVCPAACSGD